MAGLPASQENLLRVMKSPVVSQATMRHSRNTHPNVHNPALRIAQGRKARSRMQPPLVRMEKPGQRSRVNLRATRSVQRRRYARPRPAAGLEASGPALNRPAPRVPDLAQKGRLLQRLLASAPELPGTRKQAREGREKRKKA